MSTHLPPAGTRGTRIGFVNRLLTRLVTGLHHKILDLTRHRALATMGGNPVLLLTTTGRRSGRPRTHPVIGIRVGHHWYAVASNGGAASHPAWVHNILTHSNVTIRHGHVEERGTARLLTSDERDEIWPRLVEAYPTYATLQRRTNRQLPVVRLTATYSAPGTSSFSPLDT